MRPLLAAAVVAFAVITPAAHAQGLAGRWEVRNQSGGTTTLVLTPGANGQLGGSFSGNGNSFTVTGQQAGPDDGSGTITGRGMALFFQATAKGNALLLILAEPTPAGTPNMATAQQVLLTRATDVAGNAPGGARAGAGATASGAGAGAAAAGASAPRGATEADRQMIRLLTANAWCAFSYSGSQTYSGSSGTTRTERVVLTADGRVTSTSGSEFAGSGEAGSAVSARSNGQSGFWRFERGVLAFSADGTTWQPANFKMTYNSNGYPIPVVDGREYMICR